MILEDLVMNVEPYLKDVSLISYMVVFLGGVLASLTPCVYPLIPVTVGYIGARAAGNRWRGFVLSLFYVIGMAVVYACLGAIAALSGSLFGEISANPWTYLVAGNIFLLLGLSMLEVFELPLPVHMQAKGLVKKRGGIIGAFLVGLSAGFVIGPCTAPALGAVLTYVASKQNLFVGMSLLFSFALGMGMILIIVGTFAGLAVSLPKAGRWLGIIKKLFGIILILCAEYFIILAGRRFI